MYWLLGANFKLSTYNKLILFKQVPRPVWSYGNQLWGCASETNRDTKIPKYSVNVYRKRALVQFVIVV